MSISRRHIIKVVLVPVVVALLSLPLADIAFRLAGARPSDDLAGLYAAFGDGGFRHRENVATSTEWFSGPFSVFTDGFGLRCGAAASTRTPAGATVDYLVLGDSQGFGQCLDYEASVVGSLAGLAARQGRRVANCSVGGHYLRNQLEIARWLHDEHGIKAANVVVLLTPYLISSAGQYNRSKVGVDGKLYGGDPTLAARLGVWAKTHTAVFGRVRNAVRNVAGIEQDNSALLGFFDTGQRSRERDAKLRQMLGEIREWADSVGASLEIVYVPFAIELNFADVAALAAAKNRSVDPDVPLREARGAAEALGARFCDLRPVLSGIQAAGRPLSCRGDPHYNPETSAACAQSIWNALGPSSAN
jgi:hypothetical protein